MIAPMENATSDAAAATAGDGRSAGLTPSSSNAWMASALSGCAEISAAACRAVAALMPRRRSMPTSSSCSATALVSSSCFSLSTSDWTSSFCEETETNSPAAMENAPAARPARPVRTIACCDPPPPPTPAISDTLVTSPSIAPNTAGRSHPPETSRCSGPWCGAASICSFPVVITANSTQRPPAKVLPSVLPPRPAGNDVRVTSDEAAAVRRWHAETAWLGASAPLAEDVLIEAQGDRFTAVVPGTAAALIPPGTVRLPGLTLPGLANAHSHAFHRALRGAPGGAAGSGAGPARRRPATRSGPGGTACTRSPSGSTPARYFALARAVYAEMALAGITCVGEFHYLHHGPGGKGYRDPNEMGRVLIAAAAAAGLRITLLDACYLAGGFLPGGEPLPLAGVQLRFGDGSAAAWAERVSGFTRDSLGMVAPHARLGAAIHSVRAVSPDQVPEVMAWSHAHGAPVHAHLSEQPLENAECRAAFGATPAEVLYAAGALGPRSTMVHATHLTSRDIELLGGSRATVCMCPLTEADLADGVGPAPALAAAGSPLSLGSDGHSVIDLVEEARWLELSQRLVSRQRGHFTPADQAAAATASGHACLGWPDAGEIVPGAYADLVTVPLDSPRLAGGAGADPLAALFAAGTAADIRHVVASGVDVVRDGRHLLVDDVPRELAAAISAVLD